MKGTGYFRKGFSTMKFRRGIDNYEELLADGWIEYDPLAPPEQSCFGTLKSHRGGPCIHGYGWQCPQAVRVTKARARSATVARP